MVRASVASLLRLPTKPASQGARQADGVTPLEVVGETMIDVSRGQETYKLCALVVKNLDVEILAGMPFIRENDVAVRPAKHQIVMRGRVVVSYGQQPKNSSATARRTQAYLLRSPNLQSVLLPGDFIELSTPSEVEPDLVWALEPRYDVTPKMDSQTVWPPPQQIKSVDHSVRVVNNTPEPISIRRHQHCCQIRPVVPISETPAPMARSIPEVKPINPPSSSYSEAVSVDPDHILSHGHAQSFRQLHK